MDTSDCDGREEGTVKVRISVSTGGCWEFPTTVDPVLNCGGDEDDVGGLDDCCGLKGFSLLKKSLIPSRIVLCAWEEEARERTRIDRSHSLILKMLPSPLSLVSN